MALLPRCATTSGPRGPRVVRILTLAATGLGVALAVFYWLWLLNPADPLTGDARWFYFGRPLYRPELGYANGYNYSPAFELLMVPLRLLPWPAFIAAWHALLLGLLVWMAGPFTVPLLLWMPLASEVHAGNIQILLAAAICLGFRWPGTWAFVLLTKATPGVGLLWFVVRREWRPLAIALGVTAAVAGLSFVLAPAAWRAYVAFMLHGNASIPAPPWNWPFWSRLPLAVAVIVLGAWRGWRWALVVGCTLALPVFYTISPSMLVGAAYLARKGPRGR